MVRIETRTLGAEGSRMRRSCSPRLIRGHIQQMRALKLKYRLRVEPPMGAFLVSFAVSITEVP